MKKKKITIFLMIIFMFNIFFINQANAYTAEELKSVVDNMTAEYNEKLFVSSYTCNNCPWSGETCFGFHMYALNKFFGTCQNCGDYKRLYNSDIDNIGDFRVGDVMRYYEPAGYWDHSIVIIDVDVSNNRAKIMDANRDGDNYVHQYYLDYETLKYRLSTNLVSEKSAAYILRQPENNIISISSPLGVELANLGEKFTAAMVFNEGTNGKAVISANGITKGCNVEISVQDATWGQNELWNFERQTDGSYYIKNVASNLYLDVDNEETSNGTNIKLYSYSASNAQKWCIIAVKGGGYRLIPKHCYDAGLKRGLDIDAGGTTEGTNIHLWEYLGNADENTGNQVINIKNAFYCEIEDLGSEFTASMIFKKDETGNSLISANGTIKESNVEISKQEGILKENQLWNFERQNDGSYYIKNVASDLYLDVDDENTENGTNIKLYTYSKSSAQKWYIVKVDNRYRLIPKHCYEQGVRACLDIDTGATETGTNVHLWEFLGEANDLGKTQVIYIEKEIYQLGDINEDGIVNIKDWNILYSYINETYELNEIQLECADINKDGKVNIKDWNRLYNHITEVDPLS